MKSIARLFFNSLISFGTNILCIIDSREFPIVPITGPLILAGNHIGSLEVPLLFVHLLPRKIIGLAKIETWNNMFLGFLFNLWNAIPIRRGEADLDAIRACLNVLKSGDILAIAPEGTRSNHGQLLRGQPGIVIIALRSGAPILPFAHWGGESFRENIKAFRRTDFHFHVGKPFYLDTRGEKVTGKVRQEMVDEIMAQIALLLPEEYRGQYAKCNPPSQKYLRFV